MNFKKKEKKIMKKNLILILALFLSFSLYAQDNADQQQPENNTTLTGSDPGVESYELTLRADDIDDNTFPVPVPYYDDLVGGKKNLKATLDVPLKLSINNSRERRLLTVYALSGDDTEFPYGAELKEIKQIKLTSMKDANSGDTVLTEFVGPNKKIFRTLGSGENYEVDFILSITVPYFFDGYVQVAIGSSNGTHLTEICEVNNTECMTPVTFRVVPRVITSTFNSDDNSTFDKTIPSGTMEVVDSNIDLEFQVQNKPIEEVSRYDLPKEFDAGYVESIHSPNFDSSAPEKVWITNIDIYGIYPYMSNKNYRVLDHYIRTDIIRRPDTGAKNN